MYVRIQCVCVCAKFASDQLGARGIAHVIHQYPERSVDGYGAGDRGWAEIQSDQPCKVAKVTARHDGKYVSVVFAGMKGMQQMMEAGLLHAGKGVISYSCRGEKTMTADLREDGIIVCKVGLMVSPF
jgi:hypothetical protein